MQIEFYVYFQTQWGSSLNLLLQERDELGNISFVSRQMRCGNNSIWSYKLTSNDQLNFIRYQYELIDSTGKSVRECGNIREVHLPKGVQNVKIYDLWREEVEQSPFASTLFSRCFFKRETHSIKQKINGNLSINLFSPQIEPTQYVAIVGNQEVLGSWDVNKKLSLDESRFPVWSITLDVKQINFPLCLSIQLQMRCSLGKREKIESWLGFHQTNTTSSMMKICRPLFLVGGLPVLLYRSFRFAVNKVLAWAIFMI